MYDLKFVFCLASIILFLKINLILHSENFHYENICNLKENSVNYCSYYFVIIHNNSNVSAFFLQWIDSGFLNKYTCSWNIILDIGIRNFIAHQTLQLNRYTGCFIMKVTHLKQKEKQNVNIVKIKVTLMIY